MLASGARRTLTVRLARAGDSLTREILVTPPLRVHDTWGAVGKDAGFGSPALDVVTSRLDGSATDAEAVVSGDAGARTGELLFEALFSSHAIFDSVVRALFTSPGEHPIDPAKCPSRVRIVTADPALAALPWRLTRLSGALLVDAGWTFEVTPEAAARPSARTPTNRVFVLADGMDPADRALTLPGPNGLRSVLLPSLRADAAASSRRAAVLVVAPGVARGVPLRTEAHVCAIRRALAEMGVASDDPRRFAVARTRRGLRDAIERLRPEIVYFHGHSEASGGDLRWVLDAPSGGPDPVSMRDIEAWLRPSPPCVLFINACAADPASLRKAAFDLATSIPLVVANRARGRPDELGSLGPKWLPACLAAETDPVGAMHAVATAPGLHAVTATMHTSYESWAGPPSEPMPGRVEVARALAFDDQRAAARRHVRRLVGGSRRRVLALLAPAAPPSFGEPGARPLADAVQVAGDELRAPRVVHVQLMPSRDDQLHELKQALLVALGTSEGVGIRAALHDVARGAGRKPRRVAHTGASTPAPEDPLELQHDRTLVWLDWGTFGPERRLSLAQIRAWLELGAHVLAPSCPPEVRVVSSLSVQVDAERRGAFATWLAEQRDRLAGSGFEHALLPPTRCLDRADVRALVADAGPDACPPALVEEMTDRILEHAGGDFDATAALIASAQATSWLALRNVLLGSEEDDPGEAEWIL